MHTVKDYYTKQRRTFARPLEPGRGNRVLAIDLSPSDVALARVLA